MPEKTLQELARRMSRPPRAARIRRLYSQHREMLATLEQLPAAAVVADRGGFLVLANRLAQEALDIQPTDALGQDIASVVPDVTLADLFYMATLGGEPIRGEVTGAQGRRLVVDIAPLRDVGSVAILQDVTPAFILEDHKHRLIRTITHDLKNTLAAMQGYADLIIKVGEVNDRQRQFAGRVRFGATRMIDQLKDLLEVAWIEAGIQARREQTDLRLLAQDVIQQRREEANSRPITILLEETGGPFHVVGDPSQFRQMVDNLLDYAVRASPKNASVTVSIEQVGENLHFGIQAGGPFIPQEYLQRIFDRYFRFEEVAPDLGINGLELALVQAIAERHGGTVSAISSQNEGTTITVTLPAIGSAANPA